MNIVLKQLPDRYVPVTVLYYDRKKNKINQVIMVRAVYIRQGFTVLFYQAGIALLIIVLCGCDQSGKRQEPVSQQEVYVAPRDSVALAWRVAADSLYQQAASGEPDAPPMDSVQARARLSADRAAAQQDWHTWGEAQTYILASQYYLNQLESAVKSLPQLEKTGQTYIPRDSAFWSDLYNTAGAIYGEMGNFEAALRYGLQEIEFYEKIGATENLIIANNNVAHYYERRGDYDRALQYALATLHSATNLSKLSQETYLTQAEALHLVSHIFNRKKDYEKSLLYARQGIDLIKSHCPGSHVSHCMFLLKTASSYWRLNKNQKALEILEDVATILKTHHLGQLQMELNHSLGFVYLALGRTAHAKNHLLKALSAIDTTHYLYGNNCWYLSKVYQKEGNLQDALQWQQKALCFLAGNQPLPGKTENPSLQHVNSYYDMLNVLAEKGNTLELMAQKESNPGLKTDALAAYNLATVVLDSMRVVYQDDSKQFWSKEARPVLEKAIKLGLDLYRQTGDVQYLQQAFGYAEKSKSYLLREALQAASVQQHLDIPAALLQQERQLKTDISFYKNLIFREQQKDDSDNAKILLWQSEILNLSRQHEKLVAAYPKYFQIKYEQKALKINEIQQLLPEKTAIVEYFTGERATYAFYIDRAQAKAVRCEPDTTLMQLIDTLRNREWVLENSRTPEGIRSFAAASFGLYQQLIGPFGVDLPENVIFIPDGRLAYLPFELLLESLPPAENQVSYAALPYLFRKAAVCYEYSAEIALQKKTSGQHAKTFFEGYAPQYGSEAIADAVRGGLENCGGAAPRDFSPIPNNKLEINKIKEIIGGETVSGPVAGEPYFRAHAADARILHLAMHGFLNDCNPAYSGLVFSPPDPADTIQEDNDGILHAGEIYNMQLNADLVVLSACNTGRGKIAPGEGVFSLARAFKYAGCPNVVMSLWQADDAATAEIMERFYQHLKAGNGKAAALQQAKLGYLGSHPNDHPFFWGAFVLTGDNAALMEDWDVSVWLYGLALAVVVILVFFNFRRIEKRR